MSGNGQAPRRSARLAAQAEDAVNGVAALSVAESGSGGEIAQITTLEKRFEIILGERSSCVQPRSRGRLRARSRRSLIVVPSSPRPVRLDVIPRDRWASRGYDAQVAERFVHLQHNINRTLKSLGSKSRPIDRVISCSITPLQSAITKRDFPFLLPHDRRLLPYWSALSDSLQGYNDSVHLNISLVALEDSTLRVLAPGLTSVRLTSLTFVNNGLQGSSFSMVADVIRQLPTLKAFTMCRNNIGDQEQDVIARFSSSILDLPRLQFLTLASCGIGNSRALLSCIRNKTLQTIDLASNKISSEGAYFLAKFIANGDAKGRVVTKLSLDGNKFSDDKDADLFASALRVNTTLVHLDLQRNNVSRKGKKVLLKALYDDSSLNAISNSNHTCHVEVVAAPQAKSLGPLRVEDVNNPRIPKYCGRKSKILAKIFAPSIDGGSNLRYFDDMPVEIMPDVFELLQYGSGNTRSQARTLLFNILQAKPLIFVAKNALQVVVGRKRKAL